MIERASGSSGSGRRTMNRSAARTSCVIQPGAFAGRLGMAGRPFRRQCSIVSGAFPSGRPTIQARRGLRAEGQGHGFAGPELSAEGGGVQMVLAVIEAAIALSGQVEVAIPIVHRLGTCGPTQQIEGRRAVESTDRTPCSTGSTLMRQPPARVLE